MDSGKKAVTKGTQGFTLIELSIVLVIIGLIIGGILVGQDLIHGAEVRATISQIEKYNSAVNTFRNKYNGLPGDLSYTNAQSFGLLALSTSGGTQGNGDGNGLIESPSAGDKAYFLGEPPMFWYHLSQAGYVDGGFSSASNGMAALTTTTGAIGNATSAYQVNAYMPPARLGRSNSITVASSNGLNYWFIGGFNNIASTGVYSATLNTNNLTPLEAYNIDKKTDDGVANTGSIMAYNNIGSFVAANITTTALSPLANCAASGVYATSTTFANNMGTSTSGCSLRLFMQ